MEANKKGPESLVGSVMTSTEVSNLFQEIPEIWVLLEPMHFNSMGKADMVKILMFSKNKDAIREALLDNDDWLMNDSLIYYYTGVDGTCEIWW